MSGPRLLIIEFVFHRSSQGVEVVTPYSMHVRTVVNFGVIWVIVIVLTGKKSSSESN